MHRRTTTYLYNTIPNKNWNLINFHNRDWQIHFLWRYERDRKTIDLAKLSATSFWCIPQHLTPRYATDERYNWTSINNDVKRWAQACLPWEKLSVSLCGFDNVAMGNFKHVSGRFEDIYIDFIEPLHLPRTNATEIHTFAGINAQFKYQGRYFRNRLDKHWISSYGVPRSIVIDRGS